MAVLTLVISHRLWRWFDGQMELPRQPPFPPTQLALPPAAKITISVDEHSPDSIRLMDKWYQANGLLHVVVGHGGTFIEAEMRCVAMEIHEGIQTTRSVLPPIKHRFDEKSGLRLPYRDQPTFQWIAKDVHEYTLAADRYKFTAAPVNPAVVRGSMEAVH